MVVFDVEDLDLGAVGQLPVGDVGLPAFVWLLGREPLPRRSGSLVRLRGDEPAALQDPPDGGGRGQLRWAFPDLGVRAASIARIVSAAASSPWLCSLLRIPTIASSTSAPT